MLILLGISVAIVIFIRHHHNQVIGYDKVWERQLDGSMLSHRVKVYRGDRYELEGGRKVKAYCVKGYPRPVIMTNKPDNKQLAISDLERGGNFE